ncbi:cytochrome P450 [Moniliophthora roreri MCA 2997]|uniref:Cytochrome P450 n=2 Tax=Moniliophthora roreri TaxID=221103 RepID=V2WZN7_MONRO|nr:cytochrome P450 [Moniliophthora roreri MCA 2997]
MARYPDKLRHAQAEIDRVLGGKRMPTIADMPNLPYVNALIKETMRWCPVVPMSLPRRLAEDDEYMGYHIPKGTIVMPNVWCIAFAPNRRHDPHKFIPERFLDSDCTEETVDPFTYSFGFGRRACPGKALGQNSVFIFITSILASFNISFPEDCDDNPDFLGGVVR